MGGLKRVSERRTDALAEASWQQVETLLAVYYRGQGYAVGHCGTGASQQEFDGGVDLRLRKADEYILVQVKHWNACKVPHNDVHQLLGVMVNEGATGAILITSGEFTQAAIDAAARQGHVQLVDGDDLREMLGDWTRAAPASASDPDARWKRGALDVSKHVGNRLLVAAEDGLRGGRYRRHGRSAASTAILLTLAKFAIATFLMLALIFGVTRAINGVIAGVAQRQIQQAGRTPQQISTSAGSIGAQQLRPAYQRPAEIIDGPTPGLSAAEIRKQQRRADEAAKVIEANTPEM